MVCHVVSVEFYGGGGWLASLMDPFSHVFPGISLFHLRIPISGFFVKKINQILHFFTFHRTQILCDDIAFVWHKLLGIQAGGHFLQDENRK